MGARYPNPGSIKLHYSYRVDELARICGVHRNTVRSWIKQGLPTIDSGRPALVRGHDAREFLARRRREAKSTCPPGHLYCFKCRSPQLPAGRMADYTPAAHGAGNLSAICSTCERWMNRRVSPSAIDLWRTLLDITVRRAG